MSMTIQDKDKKNYAKLSNTTSYDTLYTLWILEEGVTGKVSWHLKGAWTDKEDAESEQQQYYSDDSWMIKEESVSA